MQSARTGHLVLSSIHSNDAVGILFLLLDMKVEPHFHTSTLLAVLAHAWSANLSQLPDVLYTRRGRMAFTASERGTAREFYSGTGCNLCSNTHRGTYRHI